MKLKFFLLLFGILFSLINIQAQESTKIIGCDKTFTEKHYIQWLERDAFYIITKNEKEAFLLLKTCEDRWQFIVNFWQRRDPTPNTEANEFRDEYYQRMAYANEHFARALQGWKTDRGKIHILYGKPDKIEKGRHEFEGNENVQFEKWYYKNVDTINSIKHFTFIDPTESQEFRLIKDNQ
jgi:GWxTD domain-containing protein